MYDSIHSRKNLSPKAKSIHTPVPQRQEKLKKFHLAFYQFVSSTSGMETHFLLLRRLSDFPEDREGLPHVL
jgi:hypothetical protein